MEKRVWVRERVWERACVARACVGEGARVGDSAVGESDGDGEPVGERARVWVSLCVGESA